MPTEKTNLSPVLEQLQRENRWLKRAGFLLVGISGVIFLMGGQSQPNKKTVEAEKFILRDENGKERAVLDMGKNGPRFSLLAADGKRLAILANSENGAYLHLQDSEGRPRLELSATNDWSVLNILDKNAPRVKLGAGRPPMLGLYNQNGRKIFEIIQEGPRFTLYDTDANPSFSKP